MHQIRNFDSFDLHIEYDPLVNYASLLNGNSLIKRIILKNNGGESSGKIKLQIDGYYISPYCEKEDCPEPRGFTEFNFSNVSPRLDLLMQLNEAVYTEFEITVKKDGKKLASFRFPLTLQSWNHWTPNPEAYHEIVSFVMPHQSYVNKIIEKASRFLPEGVAFNGYESSVLDQVNAIWSALLEDGIRYLTININYIDKGQKVLSPDMIYGNHSGNCLDLTLLLCACFERIGLAPCMIFVPGHVVVGVWLNNFEILPDALTRASNVISDLATSDTPSVYVVESTDVCFNATLDDAHAHAVSGLQQAYIDCLVDVIASRKAGIRSVPSFTSDLSGILKDSYDIKGTKSFMANATRRQGWERKLLDLTLRNPMLNLKPGNTIVQISENDVNTVVNHIKTNAITELVGALNTDNHNVLKELFRASRTILEENGANSLFISLGTLRWFDVDDSRPHLAPLIFIPVEIVLRKAMTYEVRLRDDEPMINVSLIEMLHQMFGISFPEFAELPKDEDGFVDWQKIFDIFSSHICEINKRQPPGKKWELPIKSYIGIFSFSKYLMWHDIHYNSDVIEKHVVVRGLIENRFVERASAPTPDFATIEDAALSQFMIPLDYDSSQLRAIAESHIGRSFVLHGPPGTGKSQTIANIISDAIYAGKRVLFVSEKKAALEVVKERLNSIGLNPFCLELHSNKTDKRTFFRQIEGSKVHLFGHFMLKENVPAELVEASSTLLHLQNHLRSISEDLHKSTDNGLSLFECINGYLIRGYNELSVKYDEISSLTPQQLDSLCDEFRSLDLVVRILGYHPGQSDLVGIYPLHNTVENENALKETFSAMPARIERARKKAKSIINRAFRKRSPEQILVADEVWHRLLSLASLEDDMCRDIDTFESYIEKWSNATEELRKWYYFSEKVNKIKGFPYPSAFQFFLDGHSGEETRDAAQSAYFKTVANHYIGGNSRLRGFRGLLHEDTITAYRSASAHLQSLSRNELPRKLEENIRGAVLSNDEERQLSVLTRRMQNHGRGVALRKIIAESRDVLQRIFPCMLMSPLSVAQYLEMRPDIFDIIIFDEASQMATPDAVGAIARGSSLIVVGDAKQLPPTQFFMSKLSDNEPLEENEDAESILEDCIAVGMPSHYLTTHYRSRHEGLIAFSNSQFYDNRLLTFPSANDSEAKVKFIDPHGVYDYGKTRTNRIEAEAVVEYLLTRIRRSNTLPSIGVIAFSKAQSNLIEDLFYTAAQNNKALQKKIADAPEPMFIKNIENVQGDERDIIVFSVGYGPDKNGNVSLNFGPLNQKGGERRLNVAVSRARQEMIVFSSLMPHHISREGVSARGVLALKDFLSYAIDENAEETESRPSHIGIVNHMASRLRDAGYDVRMHVGRSNFKVDLAVRDASDVGRYKLGIIIDGPDYHGLPTVRDREITVPSVLSSLGWRLHRVWSVDWFDNPDAVMAMLFEALQS